MHNKKLIGGKCQARNLYSNNQYIYSSSFRKSMINFYYLAIQDTANVLTFEIKRLYIPSLQFRSQVEALQG